MQRKETILSVGVFRIIPAVNRCGAVAVQSLQCSWGLVPGTCLLKITFYFPAKDVPPATSNFTNTAIMTVSILHSTSLYMPRILLWMSAWSPGMRGFAASLVSTAGLAASSLGAEMSRSCRSSGHLGLCCLHHSVQHTKALLVLPTRSSKTSEKGKSPSLIKFWLQVCCVSLQSHSFSPWVLP